MWLLGLAGLVFAATLGARQAVSVRGTRRVSGTAARASRLLRAASDPEARAGRPDERPLPCGCT